MNILITDDTGNLYDLHFLENDAWLSDTVVTTNCRKANGEWKICLVFALAYNPMQLICRYIPGTYTSVKSAEAYAIYFVKTIQKGHKATLNITYHDFNIYYN